MYVGVLGAEICLLMWHLIAKNNNCKLPLAGMLKNQNGVGKKAASISVRFHGNDSEYRKGIDID